MRRGTAGGHSARAGAGYRGTFNEAWAGAGAWGGGVGGHPRIRRHSSLRAVQLPIDR